MSSSNFYSSLADEAGNLTSPDVSEADPLEISNRMKAMDDLDDHLFSSKTKNTRSSAGKEQGSSASKKWSNDKLDDDLLDSIDDILNDECPKPATKTKKEVQMTKPVQPVDKEDEIEADSPKSFAVKMESSMPLPTSQTITKPKLSTSLFDDEDPLEFDNSPRMPKPREKENQLSPTQKASVEEKKAAKSYLEDLFGSGRRNSKTRPATGDNSLFSDDLQPLKRSVHFQDEAPNKSIFSDERPFTAPGNSGNKFVSRFEASDSNTGGYVPSAGRKKDNALSPSESFADYLSLGQEINLEDDDGDTFTVQPATVSTFQNKIDILPSSSYQPTGSEKNETPNRRNSFGVSAKSTLRDPSPDERRGSTVNGNLNANSGTKSSKASLDLNLGLFDTNPTSLTDSRIPESKKKKGSSAGKLLDDVLNDDIEEMNRSRNEDTQKSFSTPARRSPNPMKETPNFVSAPSRGLLSDEELFGTLPPRRPSTARLNTSQPLETGAQSLQQQSVLMKMSQLEMEKEHLQTMMEMLKQRHKDELQFMEESFKNKLQIIEDTHQRREQRMKDENELLSRQSVERLKILEEERVEVRNETSRQLEQAHREKMKEMERLRDECRREIDAIRREHEQAMERLRMTRVQELETLQKSAPTTHSLRAVLEDMQHSAKELSNWRSSVSQTQVATIEEKEMQLKLWEERLRNWEDRLRSQENDVSRERTRFQELVSKMDNQLREQTRQQEEERWKAKQETAKLTALQVSLEEERRNLNEQMSREKSQIEVSKQNLLNEQKLLLTQLYEERRRFGEEKSQFHAEQKLWEEKVRNEKMKSLQNEVQANDQLEKAKEEQRRLKELQKHLEDEKSKLEKDKLLNEKERMAVQAERDTFREELDNSKNRLLLVDTRTKEADEMRRIANEKLAEVKHIKMGHEERLREIQDKLNQLHQKEKDINKDRLLLARERESLKAKESTLVCMHCRGPVRDNPHGSVNFPSSTGGLLMTSQSNYLQSPNMESTYVQLDSGTLPVVRRARELSMQMERDSAMQSLKMDYERDNLFLQEEREYLRALQSFEY